MTIVLATTVVGHAPMYGRVDRREARARRLGRVSRSSLAQRALPAGRCASRRVWRHYPTPSRLGDTAPWLKLRVCAKHILVGRDMSRDTCESRGHPCAMLCYAERRSIAPAERDELVAKTVPKP